ncbi:hypothetical protein MXF39_13815 [Comamonas testosteroni]|nr:hypothetical protein [Comamonas testosteroni]
MARPPGRARLSASGHSPARLCPEAAQAGIQARGLRAVPSADRPGQDRGHPCADDGAGPLARRDGRSGRRHERARRPEPGAHELCLALGNRRHEHRGRCDAGRATGHARGRACGPQRPLPLRQRQEVQALPRQAVLTP